ncbi:hypothetical protein K0M31_004740, partial [Melipona bicolor]
QHRFEAASPLPISMRNPKRAVFSKTRKKQQNTVLSLVDLREIRISLRVIGNSFKATGRSTQQSTILTIEPPPTGLSFVIHDEEDPGICPMDPDTSSLSAFLGIASVGPEYLRTIGARSERETLFYVRAIE